MQFRQGITKLSSSISTPPDPKSNGRSDSKPVPKSPRRMKKRSKRRNWTTPNTKTLNPASMTAPATSPALSAMTRRRMDRLARRPVDRVSLRRPIRPRRLVSPRPKRFNSRPRSHTLAARPTMPIPGPSAPSPGPDRTLRSRGARLSVLGISTWAWRLARRKSHPILYFPNEL